MVSSTSVQQSYAMTTSVDESSASKQQERSSMEFIPIDQRKWNDIPGANNANRTVFSRRRKLYRDIDGAIYWCSLFFTLRGDFENEGAGTFPGRDLTDPELFNHVAIPLRWEEYLYHVGSSFTMHSITQARPIAGEKDTKEGRQTVFFTVLHPRGDEIDDEYDDSSKPEKYITQASGKYLRTQSVGSVWKKRAC